MRFFADDKEKPYPAADSDSDKHGSNGVADIAAHYPQRAAYDSSGNAIGPEYDDDLMVPCPAGTTEARLKMKIDLRIVPVLCVLYLLAFLDRVNIGNAASFNLVEDLHLEGTQFNTALVIFFVPYCLFEIPSNLVLKRFKPHIWLPGCMFMFGLASICQGLVSNYGGLLTTRFFLGLFETGMFPGCFYVIGMWYPRHEAQKRYSFFFSSTTLAGAFGGLLASAIGTMSGLRGFSGWRWIFILEGVLTCVVAIAFFWVVPDFPEDAKWLNDDERAYVKARLRVDQGKSALERRITLNDVGNVFKDFKVFLGGFMYFGLIVPAYSFAYFAPTIIGDFGYGPIQAQLHSVPPWAAAFVWSMIMAWASDRMRHRYGFAMFNICVSMAGFAMLLGLFGQLHAEYAALFLITMGTYTAMPIVVCWFQMNLGGHHRRAVGTGWQIGFGNLGGIIAVFAFLAEDAPEFVTGYSICLAFAAVAMISSTLYLIACITQNRQRRRSPVDVGLTEFEKTAMGDLSPDYRYQL